MSVSKNVTSRFSYKQEGLSLQ